MFIYPYKKSQLGVKKIPSVHPCDLPYETKIRYKVWGGGTRGELVTFYDKTGTFIIEEEREDDREPDMEVLQPLVIAAQNGDLDAFGLIVQRFQGMAYTSAYAMLEDAQLA